MEAAERGAGEAAGVFGPEGWLRFMVWSIPKVFRRSSAKGSGTWRALTGLAAMLEWGDAASA